jgi:hypothetical protein
MKRVQAFFSVRLHISGWVRLEYFTLNNFNLFRQVGRKANLTVAVTEQSVASASRHPSQFLLFSSETTIGPRRRTIITMRTSSGSQTATRTTTTRIMRTLSVVSGVEASLFFQF